jgi:hypothetical protein
MKLLYTSSYKHGDCETEVMSDKFNVTEVRSGENYTHK